MKAALDLGSNSFHLLIVRRSGASFTVVERLKEKVQLLAGFADGHISSEAMKRGLECLQRFSQRLVGLDPGHVRVSGTYALRAAHNADEFVRQARDILKTDISIISGAQEASLIHRAVDHHVSRMAAEAAVVDIGGGSTEVASESTSVSVNIGCVSFKERYFSPATSLRAGYLNARVNALAELRQSLLDAKIPRGGLVFGTSGTVQSICTVAQANGWGSEPLGRAVVERLEAAILEERWVIEAGVPGLAPDRTDIFPSGLAILAACFECLELEELRYVDVSLLQGMICEAFVGDLDVDLREDSVREMANRFAVDEAQADRVERCVVDLLVQSSGWVKPDEIWSKLLVWAARLHETGTRINPRHYHRHGGYVIKHSEMPGFSDLEKSMLALLVRGHRRSMPGLSFQTFDPDVGEVLLKLLTLLRIAVILERSHDDRESPRFTLTAEGNKLQLTLQDDWLRTHTLSARELEVEIQQLATAGLDLVVEEDRG